MSEDNEIRSMFSPKQLQRKYESMPRKARIKYLIKILISFFCVFGLIYYTSMLCKQFFRGRTVVNIRFDTSLNNKKIPSFTICYPELFSMERIAAKFDELKPSFEKYKEFLENSSEGKSGNDTYTKVVQSLYWSNFTKTVQDSKLTVNEIFNLSIPYELGNEPYPHFPIMIDIEGHHHFRNGSSYDSSVTDLDPIGSVVFLQNGKMQKCFTFFSHFYKAWRDYHMDIKEIIIRIQHNDHHFPKSNLLENNIKFAMHSPNTLPQTLRVNNFIELMANNDIEITYSRWKTKLLGPGYATNCNNYNIDDNQDYKFRSDCINHCIQQNLNQCSKEKQIRRKSVYEKCLFPTDALWRERAFILYQDLKLCQFWEQFVSYDCLYINIGQIEVQCQNKCKPDCINRYYFYELKNSRQIYDGLMQIKIVHDHIPDQTTEHLPEVNFIQFVANFGGLLGMWLGLSALVILKFVLKLI